MLAMFTPDAIIGLTLGCAIANLANIAISGLGTLGLLDVVFGSLATLIASIWLWSLRDRPTLAVLGPVVANAVIIPAYLPLLLQGLGFYTIPFTSISLDGAYIPMYLFGLVSTAIGEAVVLYLLGLPLYQAIEATPLADRLRGNAVPAVSAEKA